MKAKESTQITYLIMFILVSILFAPVNTNFQSEPQQPLITTAVGDAAILTSRYNTWKTQNSSTAQQGLLSFSLVPAKLHSARQTKGSITINLTELQLTASINHLTVDKPLGLWLTQDAQVHLDKGNRQSTVYIGEFNRDGEGNFQITRDITDLLASQFRIGQALVTLTSEELVDDVLLVGSPSLFQRLRAMEESFTAAQSNDHFRFSDLLAPVAIASVATGFGTVFNDLVTHGEDVFFNETFNGNGRTCGTCHPAENNFTLDTSFIASLPDSDPLFAAEFIPALIFGNAENLDEFGNPRRLENPALMRNFGLIVENMDGTGDLANRFTMRSIPHNIGMSVSVDTPPNDLTPPDDRAGWSGDGAAIGLVGGVAASGRVRDFLLGAIVQHFPKTMNRSFIGSTPDFRIATIAELDAVEAFLFAIGRQQELDLAASSPNQLILASPSAEAGKVLFRDGIPESTRTCNACHSNAGANVNGGTNPGNRNFNTGVELFLQNRVADPNFTVLGEPRPVDGGFGTNPAGNFTSLVAQPGFVNENFGNNTFNTASLVEAADSPPFFHNNIANTLEEAIAFYNSAEFAATAGNPIPFSPEQITQVANFLRVINALDNIENAVLRQSQRAILALNQNPLPNDVIARIIMLMKADTEDAIEVLNQGNLHNSGGSNSNAVLQLDQAKVHFMAAITANNSSANARIRLIEKAQRRLQNALDIMRL